MTVYADYNFYTNEYLAGKSAAVTAADFPYYARQTAQKRRKKTAYQARAFKVGHSHMKAQRAAKTLSGAHRKSAYISG